MRLAVHGGDLAAECVEVVDGVSQDDAVAAKARGGDEPALFEQRAHGRARLLEVGVERLLVGAVGVSEEEHAAVPAHGFGDGVEGSGGERAGFEDDVRRAQVGE